MPGFSLSVPFACDGGQITDFGTIIELARRRACELDRVVYITLDMANPGSPNRWAVSPKGYLSAEGVAMAACIGCGDG